MIAQHRAKVLARQPRFVTGWWHEYEPGRKHVAPDGGEIIATDKELIYLDATGAVIRTEPNGGAQYTFPVPARLKEPSFELFDRERAGAAPTKNGDDQLFETYLQHANVGPKYAPEARAVWELYKALVGKPLKDATRDDGRRLVAHFEQQGNKSATIQKKLSWLVAACNFAIREGRLKFNPFSSIVPKKEDKLRRLPLDADDIANIKRNLNRLSASDQLLVRVLATTGCRLSEAFEISTEATESGVRYVVVGHKTKESLRRIALPADLLPFLSARIERPLFQGDAGRASRTLGKFLRDIGIKDPRKVTHSLRHRAKDRLRAAGCPLDVQYELLGHEEQTVASGYGRGSPVPLLKRWVDEIGF
ncbi:MAG: site-specific integrase [Xanthobacteraceae bacterium]